MRDDRSGAKQPHIFSHERANVLDDDEREGWFAKADVIALIDAPAGSTVVDFGAGTGRYALAIASARRDLRVVAYDVQPEMCAIIEQRAREQRLENVEVTSSVPTPESADLVLAANVFHEIGDAAVVTIRESLRPGAAAIVADWDAEIDRPTGPPAEHAYTKKEALDRLERLGFHDVRFVASPQFPYHYVLRGTA
jgi:ubiquinone/menaquinone biosynthesis C-methylase UbiE